MKCNKSFSPVQSSQTCYFSAFTLKISYEYNTNGIPIFDFFLSFLLHCLSSLSFGCCLLKITFQFVIEIFIKKKKKKRGNKFESETHSTSTRNESIFIILIFYNCLAARSWSFSIRTLFACYALFDFFFLLSLSHHFRILHSKFVFFFSFYSTTNWYRNGIAILFSFFCALFSK